MNYDEQKLKYAIDVISEIIKDGERYYIDDWTNALHYTKSVLESHLGGDNISNIIREMNHVTGVKIEGKKDFNSQPTTDDDDHGDNIQW